ncbi:hypothetical protein EMEDMD4_10105 [Sinorhizobium medicae]|uniref:Uncharacterized protein n=1 Tax=Sinorhizobium medicae TaxID=110321 RepID=A0A508WTE2_9HYPH|nr:hypothetical protein EMEDMD4_10105 [Sinorhizobium medicae]
MPSSDHGREIAVRCHARFGLAAILGRQDAEHVLPRDYLVAAGIPAFGLLRRHGSLHSLRSRWSWNRSARQRIRIAINGNAIISFRTPQLIFEHAAARIPPNARKLPRTYDIPAQRRISQITGLVNRLIGYAAHPSHSRRLPSQWLYVAAGSFHPPESCAKQQPIISRIRHVRIRK